MPGLQVKADYVPLLQSLATYGWRLTCVLPTPVIKTNSDGSLSTKQIVFLQRPVLGRKRRESKKLIFKPRGKSAKNCVKDTAKNKKKKRAKAEKGVEDSRIVGDRERAERDENKSRDEKMNATNAEAAGDGGVSKEEGERCGDDRKIDDGIEIRIETTVERKGEGGERSADKGAENGTEEEEEEEVAAEGEGSKENGEPAENGEAHGVTETVATVEAQSETKEEGEEDGVGEAAAVVENGIGTDEETDKDGEDAIKDEPEGSAKVVAKETVAESQNQNPDETLE